MHGFLLRPDLPLEVKFAESNAERTQRLKGRADGSPTTPLSPLPVPEASRRRRANEGREGEGKAARWLTADQSGSQAEV